VRHGRGRHTCSTGDYFGARLPPARALPAPPARGARGAPSHPRSWCSSDGEWRRDLRHGQGLAVFASGLRYEGTWKEDKAEGTGTCVYPCGDKARAAVLAASSETCRVTCRRALRSWPAPPLLTLRSRSHTVAV